MFTGADNHAHSILYKFSGPNNNIIPMKATKIGTPKNSPVAIRAYMHAWAH